MQGTAAISLHVLEDVICRVHKLHPDADNFLSECSSLTTLILHGRVDDADLTLPKRNTRIHKILCIDAIREVIEGLIVVEVLLAARIGRPASFANVVRLMRATYITRFRGASDSDKATRAHLQNSIEFLPIPERLRPVLRAFATRDDILGDQAFRVIKR